MYWGLWETDEGYVEKALEMGISFIGAPLGNLEGGSFTRDFERRMQGALEMERLFHLSLSLSLSLRELCERNLEGDSLTWDPEGYAKEGSGNGHLFP
jgi:hypothetical protein